MSEQYLLDNIVLMSASAATSAAFKIMRPGRYQVSTYGTWGGAVLRIEYSPDGGTTWIPYDGTELSANGGVMLSIGPALIRVAYSVAGTSPSLTSVLAGGSY